MYKLTETVHRMESNNENCPYGIESLKGPRNENVIEVTSIYAQKNPDKQI